MFCSKKKTFKVCVINSQIPTLVLEGICNKNTSTILEKYLNDLVQKGHLHIAIDIRKFISTEIKCYSVISKANQVMLKHRGHLEIIKYNGKMQKAMKIIRANRLGLSA